MFAIDLPLPESLLTVDFAKNLSTGVSIGSIVFALLFLKLMKSMVMRMVTTVLFLAIGLAFYFQRNELASCADKVEAGALAGQDAVCSFFGRDVTINLPDSLPDIVNG